MVNGVGRISILSVGLLITLMLPFSVLGQDVQRVTFLPQWTPQAQFAGYYVAVQKGFYQQRGIDLHLLPGGPDSPPAEFLKCRKADFTTMFLSEAIHLRVQGLKLVNVAQIGQKSGFILIARKSSRIFTPEDLSGKRVGLWLDSQIQALAFFRKHRIQVQVIPQTYTVNLFLRGGLDAISAMWYNEYHTILNSGVNADELTTFFFDRKGLNFPEDGIYCLHESLSHKDICRKFIAASLEGWRYAFDHPDEAIDIVMAYVQDAHSGTNRVHQRWMLDRIRDISLVNGDTASMGKLSAEDYHTVAQELQTSGMIDHIPNFDEFYVPCLDNAP